MKNIAQGLSIFQSKVGVIGRSSSNPFFKSKYASLEDILPAIQPSLQEAGLTFTQIPTGENELRTIIIHVESGESIEGTYKMTPAKNDPQGQGAAITYMRRYALVAMLGLNTDEDDDGNKASTPESKTVKFEQAKKIILSTKNKDVLIDSVEKIKQSTVYNDTQKKELEQLISKQIDEIDSTS